jgi:hypothetical protein
VNDLTEYLTEFFVAAILLPMCFAALWSVDRLVRLEYASHRESWEEDGKPHGLFFCPPETDIGRGARETQKLTSLQSVHHRLVV